MEPSEQKSIEERAHDLYLSFRKLTIEEQVESLLKERAYIKGATDQAALSASRISELEAECENLRSVMVAAAEEIQEHWQSHCDEEGYVPVFLEPHPDYPNVKDISMKKGRQPKGLMECHGFCNTID